MAFTKLPNDQVVLVLTLACNMQCPHCLRGFNRSPHLDTALAFKVIDEMAELGFDNLHMTGGEPALHPDFRKICEYAASKGMWLGITTNGSLLEKYRFLMGALFKPRRLQPMIRVSLDGPTAEVHDRSRKEGSFEKAIAFYKAFHDFGYRVRLHTCISKWNFPHVSEMMDLAEELKTPHLTFGSVTATGEDNKDLALTDLERQQAVQKIVRRRNELVERKSVTKIGAATTLKNGTGPRFCSILRHERSTLTLNAFGVWSFCCDVGLDGDMSIGNYPEVSVSSAFEGLRKVVEDLVAYRLNFYQNNTFVEGWFDNCNFCNRLMGGKVFSNEDIRLKRKVIPIVPDTTPE